MCQFCGNSKAVHSGSVSSAGPLSSSENVNNFLATFGGTHQNNMLALVAGMRWNSTSLSYSFPDSGVDYGSYHTGEASTFESLNNVQKDAARAAFSMIESYANVTFAEMVGNDGGAQIRMSESSMPSTAWAYLPDTTAHGGDVWLGKAYYNNPIKGTYAWHTIMHELGHSMGLKHGHENTGYGALDAQHDEMAYSLMTYHSHANSSTGGYTNEYYGYAQTFMAYDIAALQALYGVNWSTNKGDTVYSWSSSTGQMFVNGVGDAAPASNRIFATIWDGGGKDTIDLSNYNSGISGSMDPGGYLSFSQSQKAQLAGGVWADGNVYFALAPDNKKKAMIDHLITGKGDDFIFGNSAHNTISGKGGKDDINGKVGNDILLGGGGRDTLNGATGKDTIDGGIGKDILRGGGGNDVFVLNERSGKDIIRDFKQGEDYIDVPDTALATLIVNPMGHLTVDYMGAWSVLRGLTYDPLLDPLDFII